MIDYFFKFLTEAAAIADAAGSIYYTSTAKWNADRVVPDLQIWRNSQDVAGPLVNGVPTIVHTLLTGWFGVVSLDHIDATLLNHAALQVALDRDKAAAGLPAILKSNVTTAMLNDLRFQPVFAGASYPFGAII